jgi:hypothetical protein
MVIRNAFSVNRLLPLELLPELALFDFLAGIQAKDSWHGCSVIAAYLESIGLQQIRGHVPLVLNTPSRNCTELR